MRKNFELLITIYLQPQTSSKIVKDHFHPSTFVL